MAEVKIWPRGQNETGGILLMPMKKNIPKGHPEWSLVKCPICGQECWRPMSRQGDPAEENASSLHRVRTQNRK